MTISAYFENKKTPLIKVTYTTTNFSFCSDVPVREFCLWNGKISGTNFEDRQVFYEISQKEESQKFSYFSFIYYKKDDDLNDHDEDYVALRNASDNHSGYIDSLSVNHPITIEIAYESVTNREAFRGVNKKLISIGRGGCGNNNHRITIWNN